MTVTVEFMADGVIKSHVVETVKTLAEALLDLHISFWSIVSVFINGKNVTDTDEGQLALHKRG